MSDHQSDDEAPLALRARNVASGLTQLLGAHVNADGDEGWLNVAKSIARLVDGCRTIISVLDARTGRLRIIAETDDLGRALAHPDSIALDEGVMGAAFNRGTEILVADYDRDPRRIANVELGVIGPVVALPLTTQHRGFHGVMAVARDRSHLPYTEDELDILRACAAIVSSHLERASLIAHSYQTVEARIASEERERLARDAHSRLISTLSHELRTPLNAVYGFAQLLALDEDCHDNDQSELIESLLLAAKHLSNVLASITDLDMISSGKMTMDVEPVAVEELLAPFVAILGADAKRHGRRLDVELDPHGARVVAVDAQRLRQALVNIGSNAVKYNRPGGVVRLRIVKEATALAILVEDTGFGIAHQHLERVFEPFVRLPSGVRTASGSGLGLSVARAIVQAMGGSLTVTSEEGIGTSVWLRLRDATPGEAL